MNSYRVGLIVPTLNAGPQWAQWLALVNEQTYQPARKLVVDSSSSDQTREIAAQHGFEVIKIDKMDFNHGGTRDMAVKHLADCDILVFLTQDALLHDKSAVAEIISSFSDPRVAAAYGRQLPHVDAGPIGAHARIYNYGMTSISKSSEDIPVLGFKTIFCSNSFSAYRREDYLQIGGFKKDLIFGEDAHICGRLVLAGKSIFYNAKAAVYHSHDYSIKEDARRYFDIGVFHRRDEWMVQSFGGATGEGARFVRSELRYLAQKNPLLLPSVALRTLVKFTFYRLGRMEQKLPLGLKRSLSMNRRFWK